MTLFYAFKNYIISDWKQNPYRVIGEIYGWVVSGISSLIFALTVPDPPFLLLYPLWLSGLFVMIMCVKSRGSTGLLALYITLAVIDIVGFSRLLMLEILK